MKIPNLKGLREELIKTRENCRCASCSKVIPKYSVVWKRDNYIKFCYDCGIKRFQGRLVQYQKAIKDTKKLIRKAEYYKPKMDNINMCASLGEGSDK